MENPDSYSFGLKKLIKANEIQNNIDGRIGNWKPANNNYYRKPSFINDITVLEYQKSENNINVQKLLDKQTLAFTRLLTFFSNEGQNLPLFYKCLCLKTLTRFVNRCGVDNEVLPKFLKANLALARELKNNEVLSIATGMKAEYCIAYRMLDHAIRYCNESYHFGSQPQRLLTYRSLIYALGNDWNRSSLYANNALNTLNIYHKELETRPYTLLAFVRMLLIRFKQQPNEAITQIKPYILKLKKYSDQSVMAKSAYFQAVAISRSLNIFPIECEDICDDEICRFFMSYGRYHGVLYYPYAPEKYKKMCITLQTAIKESDTNILPEAWIIDTLDIDNHPQKHSLCYLTLI